MSFWNEYGLYIIKYLLMYDSVVINYKEHLLRNKKWHSLLWGVCSWIENNSLIDKVYKMIQGMYVAQIKNVNTKSLSVTVIKVKYLLL